MSVIRWMGSTVFQLVLATVILLVSAAILFAVFGDESPVAAGGAILITWIAARFYRQDVPARFGG